MIDRTGPSSVHQIEEREFLIKVLPRWRYDEYEKGRAEPETYSVYWDDIVCIVPLDAGTKTLSAPYVFVGIQQSNRTKVECGCNRYGVFKYWTTGDDSFEFWFPHRIQGVAFQRELDKAVRYIRNLRRLGSDVITGLAKKK